LALATPAQTALNVALLALGIAAMGFLMLASRHMDDRIERDVRGIDAVVGSKSSPLQLILSGVLHWDAPAGNIPLEEFEALKRHASVARAVPISLGDNFAGSRIVGTDLSYPQMYSAQLAQGVWFEQPMQAVLGASVRAPGGLDMPLAATFFGTHGLGQGGEVHDAAAYTVVGRMKPCGCVLDRLILTATESVWQVHEKTIALDEADRQALIEAREVTLALIQYKSPLAAATFVRQINSGTQLQAASPALEISKLLRILGVGTDVLQAMAVLLVIVAALSTALALMQAVRERRADLALVRLLGGSPSRCAALLLGQAMGVATLGLGLGWLGAHALAWGLAQWAQAVQSDALAGFDPWQFTAQELWLPALAYAVALLAAAWPAWRASRVDVAELLGSF
jgi:putative ABC transport system permease protein